MTRKNKAKCKAYAIWYVRELLEWRTDFLKRASQEPGLPSREIAAEFRALRHASLHYLGRLIEYVPVKEG
jgi:hypothetical protein